jgi:methylisocitrate lyase
MNKNAAFRQRLNQKGIIVAPGCYDALTAKLVEKSGFEALYMTGAGVSMSTLGIADVGLTTLSEMLMRVSQISQAVEIPLIADGDTGYGNPLNVYRTIREYEHAGASAIHIEDQMIPKKCGHKLGRKLITKEEMQQKIKAATDARRDGNFVIIARTDARTEYGFPEALDRAKAYEEAGADVIFVESVQSQEEMRIVHQTINKPTFSNMVEGGRTPLLSARELEEIGYKIVIFPNAIARIMTKSAMFLLKELKGKGTTKGLLDRMFSHTEFFDLFDFDHWVSLESKYLKVGE